MKISCDLRILVLTLIAVMSNIKGAPDAVLLSESDTIFDIAFTAQILQPTSSNLHYAVEALPLPVPTPNWSVFEVSPKHHFGFDIELGWTLRKHSTKLFADWQHFKSTDSASQQVAPTDMVGPFFEIGPNSQPYKIVHGTAAFNYDMANLDYSLSVDFGERLQTLFFCGLSFTRIKQTNISQYSNPAGTVTRAITTPSTFTGGGLQCGADFSYCILGGFYCAGQAAVTLLTGRMQNGTTYQSTAPTLAGLGITPPNTQTTTVPNRTQVVPGFQERLGFGYTYGFCNGWDVRLEAGYQLQIYINALQSVDMGSEVIDVPTGDATTGVYARTFQRTLSNFALSGVYIMLDAQF